MGRQGDVARVDVVDDADQILVADVWQYQDRVLQYQAELPSNWAKLNQGLTFLSLSSNKLLSRGLAAARTILWVLMV